MQSSEVGAYWEENAPAWTLFSRAGYDVYRDALNTPAFLAMLPDVEGLSGLDIGCGEGTNTRRLAKLGARMTAVDIAPAFIAAARDLEAADPHGVDFRIGDATGLDFSDGSFEFATAFMSLMDMPNQARALGEAYRVLAGGGFLQFSILHPCFAPPIHKNLKTAEGLVYAVMVGDYFRRTEGELETWTFGAAPAEERDRHPPFKVPRFHRTLSDWISMILDAGFLIEKAQEPMADAETARRHPGVADQRVAPLFLHFRVRKPGIAAG